MSRSISQERVCDRNKDCVDELDEQGCAFTALAHALCARLCLFGSVCALEIETVDESDM